MQYEKIFHTPEPVLNNEVSNPINVHALLILRGIKQVDIARKHFLNSADINRVIHGRRKTAHIRKIIATELGMLVDEIWPN